MITHRNAAINTIGTLLHLPMGVGSRYLWTLPILHANGWTYTWTVPPTAGTHICLRKVDPATIFGLAPGVTRLAGFGLARWRAEAAGRGNEACFQATVLNSDPGPGMQAEAEAASRAAEAGPGAADEAAPGE